MDLKEMALDLPYIKNNPHSMQVRSSNHIDFIDLGELIKNKNSLQKGFEASVAIARLSPLGSGQLNLICLQEDLKSKTLNNILAKNPEYIEIIKESASKINIEKAMKTRLKANQDISSRIGLTR